MAPRLTIHATNRFERARAKRRAVFGGVCVVGMLLALATIAHAEGTPTSAEDAGRQALLDALAPALAARGATATVNVTPPDARRNLAPCQRFSASIPPGARLTGRTMVAVRCIDGATWQTFLSADIRVEAPVWEATRALRPGDALGSNDVRQVVGALQQADLEAPSIRNPNSRGLATIDPRGVAVAGRTLQRPVGTGRALVLADLRDDGRINPGDTVKVVYQGEGFSVTSEGRSVGAADPGSNVLIRLASGTVVNGTLRPEHLVELPK